jgi:salicylate hydroxylase
MNRDAARVLIAGGGIGGFAAALALSRAGIPSEILERSHGASESGAGIQLGPNATRILTSFGLRDALLARASRPEAIRMFDGPSGRELNHVPLGDTIERRHGAPYLVLGRADLHALLRDAAEASALVTSEAPFRVERYAQTAGHIDAVGDTGAARRGAALIGADGVRSDVRTQIAPGSLPRLAGHAAWRATIPMAAPAPFADNITGLWMGPGAHLVHYPVDGGARLNLVAVLPERDRRDGWETALARHFANWCDPVRALIAGAAGWSIWSVYTMSSPRLWSDGRAALLGDAAHPLAPYLAQGAALAIEDAADISNRLRNASGDIAGALRAYALARRPRAIAVQRHAARLGRLYHLRSLAGAGRNLILSRRRPEDLLASLDWLYADPSRP